MSIQPFTSKTQLFDYAKEFLRDHERGFRKNLAICMRADANRSHAYFPALMTCIGFFDLLSGLHAGKLEYQSIKELEDYIKQFVRNKSDYQHIDIMYYMLRHKIAHLAHPYLVFDTSSKPKLKPPHRRITWTVGIYAGEKAIELIDHEPKTLVRIRTPWAVSYNARIKISLSALRNDAIGSIYLAYLRKDSTAQIRFAKCIKEYAPP